MVAKELRVLRELKEFKELREVKELKAKALAASMALKTPMAPKTPITPMALKTPMALRRWGSPCSGVAEFSLLGHEAISPGGKVPAKIHLFLSHISHTNYYLIFFSNFAGELNFIEDIMNKRMPNLLLKGAFFVYLALLGACSDDNPWRYADGEGGIAPTVSTSAEINKSTAVRAESTVTAPDVEQFGLTLTKSDGTYSKTWASTTLFPTDQGFKVGTYTMTAFYGSLDDEGFERPFFQGSETFQVMEDRTTDVAITATLANSMVSIAYTDAFRAYFSDWSAKLHSEGGAYVDYPKGETRAAYLRPGHVDIALNITKPNGVSALLQPANFDAEPRHHYRITFDVYNGEVGEAQLRIIFDDTIDEENVDIDLSDELLTAPAPEVSPQGFTAGETLQLLESNKPAEPVRYFIRAKSGISGATLTVQSSATLPVGREFDFCALTADQQAAVRASGIKETGLSRNPGTLAQVDLTDFIATLPAGTHIFTMVVKDKMTKINEPLELTVTTAPLTFEVPSVSSVPIGSRSGNLVVSTNGSDVANSLKIQGYDDYGALQDCPITSVTERTNAPRRTSGGFAVKQYNVAYTLPQSSRDVKILITYKGRKVEKTVQRAVPSYTLAADPFARHAVLKVTADNATDTRTITENLRIFSGNTELTVASRNAASGLLTVEGLSPAQNYTFKSTVLSGSNPTFQQQVAFTTETESGVPNGDFETLHETHSATAMEQGGKYKRTYLQSGWAQNHQAFTISEPTGWASTNAKTMYSGAGTQNSWFVPASVFNTSLSFVSTQAKIAGIGGDSSTPDAYKYAAHHGSNAMVIRNVAWDPSGTLPANHTYTAAGVENYFHPTAPSIANRAAGKLFLGTYAYNGSETISEGIAFAVRPSKLTGYYRYIQDSQDTGEHGTVTVKLMHGNQVIGQGTANLTAANAFSAFTVNISYSTYFLKADKLCIMFSSSNRSASAIKTTSRAERYLQESTGATLIVDNLSFKY